MRDAHHSTAAGTVTVTIAGAPALLVGRGLSWVRHAAIVCVSSFLTAGAGVADASVLALLQKRGFDALAISGCSILTRGTTLSGTRIDTVSCHRLAL